LTEQHLIFGEEELRNIKTWMIETNSIVQMIVNEDEKYLKIIYFGSS